MKKLMIAAAIALTAVASQAATFIWSTSAQAHGPAVANLYTAGDYGAGTATSDRMKKSGTDNGITWSYVMALTTGGETKEISGEITTYSSNKIAQSIASDFFTLPTDDSTKTYSWSVVITGTYSKNGVDYTATSGALTGSADYTKLSEPKIETAAPSSWTIVGGAAPTPEPTSGLLVLLGVAGLALRRKRA